MYMDHKITNLLRFVIAIAVLKSVESIGPQVGITFLGGNAVAKGAVCLDGSPGAYHFDPGFESGSRNWLVFLEGGGWCSTKSDCLNRRNSRFGSSSNMDRQQWFSGILSKTQSENPDFYNWNRVLVRYCDGASFMANVEAVDPGTNLRYRGARIFNAVMDELVTKGMSNATNAILTGCSAGGLAAILHCDSFRALLPNANRVKCIPDAGFFIHAKDLPGAKKREQLFGGVVATHELAKVLPSSCTSRMDPGLCLFPENVVGDIKTPIFLLNSAFDSWQIQNNLDPPVGSEAGWKNCAMDVKLCTPTQLQTIKDFRNAFLETLKGIGDSSSRGMLINSCYVHCYSYGGTWNVFRSMGNKTIAEVIGEWYIDGSSFQEIDTQHDSPNNCSVLPSLR